MLFWQILIDGFAISSLYALGATGFTLIFGVTGVLNLSHGAIMVAAAVAAWAERSSRLAVDIAGRLAARLDGAAVRAAFLEWLIREIRALPSAVRQAEVASGAPFEAISATALDPADQERCRALIGEAFGAQPQIAFRTDPGLIAGLELHGPHLVVSNSWRADLARILADLAHDDRR